MYQGIRYPVIRSTLFYQDRPVAPVVYSVVNFEYSVSGTKVGVRGPNVDMEIIYVLETPHLPIAIYSMGKHGSTRAGEGRRCRTLIA